MALKDKLGADYIKNIRQIRTMYLSSKEIRMRDAEVPIVRSFLPALVRSASPTCSRLAGMLLNFLWKQKVTDRYEINILILLWFSKAGYGM